MPIFSAQALPPGPNSHINTQSLSLSVHRKTTGPQAAAKHGLHVRDMGQQKPKTSNPQMIRSPLEKQAPKFHLNIVGLCYLQFLYRGWGGKGEDLQMRHINSTCSRSVFI